MALLMVHLKVAELFVRLHPEYADVPEFYLGCISPDAIHVRDHHDKSRKNYFHLGNWCDPHPDRVLAYWRNARTPFDVGYGVHVLTDAQWVPRFHRIDGLMPGGQLDKEQYYHDTLLTDFAIAAEDGFWTRMRDILFRAVPPTDHPLLTAEEFAQWREDTRTMYEAPCRATGVQRYIDRPYVDRFLAECMDFIDDVYRQAFVI